MSAPVQLCERPFLAGDPSRHESWARLPGCDRPATRHTRMKVVRSVGKRFRDRRLVEEYVDVYSCGVHSLRLPGITQDITQRRIALRPRRTGAAA